jgi:hypothetical protein
MITSKPYSSIKMGGRSLRLLVLSAVLLTFTANLLFVLQTRECYKETKEIFPWLKNKLDVEVSKVVKYSDEGAIQDNLGKRIKPGRCGRCEANPP